MLPMNDPDFNERQGASPWQARGLRFAVVTDAHVEHPGDARAEYLRAALEAAQAHRPAFIVFAGDLVSPQATSVRCDGETSSYTHPTGDTVTSQAAARDDYSWTRDLFESADVPVHQLRGNVDVPLWPEPLRFAFALGAYVFIGFDTATGTLTEAEDRWLRETLQGFGDRPKIFFTHYYADALDPPGAERLMTRLDESQVLHLISGHGHRHGHHVIAQTRHHLVEAIDPFKPGSRVPGYELFEFDGDMLRRSHHRVSLLAPEAFPRFLGCLGCAPGDPGSEAQLTALIAECGLRHVQFKLSHSVVRALGGANALPDLRSRLDVGTLQTLSIHGSNPDIDGTFNWMNQATVHHEIEICRESGAASVTTHLPPWDARILFDSQSGTPTSLADALADALAAGFGGYWQSGIRIDLENTHWYDPSQYPDVHGEHQFGIKINHLLWAREQLEARLTERWGEVAGSGVGFCFDVGHALTNGPLASTMTVPDWFVSLGPQIRSIHLHDVMDLPKGGRQAHFPMGVDGGLVGLEGLVHLWHRYSPDAILLLEVETLEDVRRSVEYIRQWIF